VGHSRQFVWGWSVKHAACFTTVIILTLAHFSLADDQQKLKKELTKITAMATDATGRAIVNQSMAEMFSVKRLDLVAERRDTGLNYGGLFVAHELTRNGLAIKDIATRLNSGKDIFHIGAEVNANWKEINDHAKKLNTKIDNNLYNHFLHAKKDQPTPATSDDYSVAYDGVRADKDVSQSDIDQAQDRYQLWLSRASSGPDKRLGTADQKSASYDHVRNGPLTGDAAPSGGGIPH
jgi:hypothetical protein